MNLRRIALIGVPAIVLAVGMAGTASAASTLVNGNFDGAITPTSGTGSATYGGQIGANVTIPGWSMAAPPPSSYGLIWTPNHTGTGATSADSPGVNSQYGPPPVILYGPGNGIANGLTATLPNSETHNFVGADPAFQNAAIMQSFNGSTAGQYTLSFYYAAAEQVVQGPASFSGGWNVSVDGSPVVSVTTPTVSPKGFSGWIQESLTVNLTGTDSISFLANGAGGQSVPPFALLSDVTLTFNNTPPPVPEPASMSLLALGLLGIAVARLRRRS